MNSFEKLKQVLQCAWCRQTCSPSLRNDWNKENPAKGQCFVTAMAVQKYLGGEVYELYLPDGEIHFFNRIKDMVLDFSASQFDFELPNDFYDSGVLCDTEEKLKDPVKRERLRMYFERVSEYYERN